jgi:hypothetical protein
LLEILLNHACTQEAHFLFLSGRGVGVGFFKVFVALAISLGQQWQRIRDKKFRRQGTSFGEVVVWKRLGSKSGGILLSNEQKEGLES